MTEFVSRGEKVLHRAGRENQGALQCRRAFSNGNTNGCSGVFHGKWKQSFTF